MRKRRLFLYLFLVTSTFVYSQSLEEEYSPILIIRSYNYDTQHTLNTIDNFAGEYARLGGKSPIQVEHLFCSSFTQFAEWKKNMGKVLEQYATSANKPSLIVLLGQEARGAFLAQEEEIIKNVPVITGEVSLQTIRLDSDSLMHTQEWIPQSIDYTEKPLAKNIKGGFLYNYNIKENIALIHKLYPGTKNIAFISGNTFTGITLQAHMIKEMKNHPELNLILLDGRTKTIYTVLDELRNLPPNTVIIVGSWRTDKLEGRFVKNATYLMMEAAADVPAFTLSSTGLGYWVIGGVMPAFADQGKGLAKQAFRILKHEDNNSLMEYMPEQTTIDCQVAYKLGVDLSSLPEKTYFVNKTQTLYQAYKYEFWSIIIIFILLLTGFLITVLFYLRTKKLKDKLAVSEKELRKAIDRAKESNRLKSAFLANMSHEIRTPLNSIVGFSNVLAMEQDLSMHERKTYTEIIQSNSEVLLRLINDILDLSRLESGKVTLSFKDTNVIKLIQSVVASLKQSAKNDNNIIIDTATGPYTICTDAERLRQVLTNLISNSIKFTHDGTIIVTFSIDKKRNYAVFSVADTGEGIPAEKYQAVFKRFEKLNEHTQGTGLGLPICKTIVQKWGGKIWIDPQYTQGARFVFTHPLHIDLSQPEGE